MDGLGDAIHAGKAPEKERAQSSPGRGRERLDIPLLDLQATFAEAYAHNRQRFATAYDWHWNGLANRLVGKAIARLLVDDPGVSARSVLAGAGAARPPQG